MFSKLKRFIFSGVYIQESSAQTYLEYIVNNLPHFLFWKDKNGIFLGCNKEFARSAGFESPQDIIGKTDYEMPWHENAPYYIEDDQRIMRAGKPKLNYEESQRQKDGTNKIMLVSKVPMFNHNNKIIGILGVYTDISERKEMEEQIKEAKEKAEAANNAKTAFLENMRHDIRTPLSGIVGLAELLEKEYDNNKIKKYTHVLVESSKELLHFLNQILETINVASGEIPLLKKKFNLRTVLENAIKLHQPKANEKNLNLEFFFDDNIPKYLIGDPIRIYRIVLELLVNALKFTKEGYVKLSAKLAKQLEHDMVLQIEIEDTGPGIPVEKQPELFVRFKRLVPSYQGIYKGSGLGLAIVKQFIDDLQGEIHYMEGGHKGAKFICLIPVKKSLLENNLGEDNYDTINMYSSLWDSDTKKLKPLIEDLNIISKDQPSILIVEDQVITANVVETLLIKLGCKVEIAENGNSAIEMIKHNRYDLIFMDIGLPDINGYDVTKRIRSQENSSERQVPIIGLTAHVDKEKKQQGLEIGMNLVLTKPLLEETAIAVLENYIPNYLSNRRC